MTGTLVDVDSATAYAAAATGNAVDAIDIATGEVIWTSERGATPRLLAERYVWAAGSPEEGCLEWVLIDRESGRTVGTWQIGLPSGVLPTFDERLGHSFGLAQPLGEREEGHVGGGVVQEGRQDPRRPEELPRRLHTQLAPARPQQLESGDHGQEDPEEEYGHLHHRARGEAVRAADRGGRTPEG